MAKQLKFNGKHDVCVSQFTFHDNNFVVRIISLLISHEYNKVSRGFTEITISINKMRVDFAPLAHTSLVDSRAHTHTHRHCCHQIEIYPT